LKTYRGLAWADSDNKLAQVFDWVSDLDVALPYVAGRFVCVQAGGACGQWPAALAEHFKRVITFEPVVENYECLAANVPDNVEHYNAAVGNSLAPVTMVRDDFEQGNAGAWYAVPGGSTEVIAIDSLILDACDFIQLDVEGFECEALRGAEETLRKYRPVVMVEEKPLPHAPDPFGARLFLENLGYSEVSRAHRDVVFTC